jgi:predicted RNA binding protein YcfA (HicA-like mRNA interferase family)
MSRSSNLTPKQVLKALLKGGFVQRHQAGTHLTLRHPDTGRHVTVPLHPGDLFRELLKDLIKDAGMTEEQFQALL